MLKSLQKSTARFVSRGIQSRSVRQFTLFDQHGNEMNSSPYDWQKHARGLYREYFADARITQKHVIHILKSLSGCKMGVCHTDIEFIKFMTKLQKDVQGIPLNSEGIKDLVLYSSCLNFKEPKYWEAVFGLITSKEKEYDVSARLFASKLFLQTKSCQDRLKIILPFITQSLKDATVPKVLSTLNYSDLVNFAVSVTKLNLNEYKNVYPVIATHAFQNRTTIDTILGANSLSDLAYVLFKGIPFTEDIRSTIIGVAHAYQQQDEISFDAILQDYEFRDQNPSAIGVTDPTRWPNVANMVTIFSDPEYQDNVLLHRFEESIFRKSESDLIDFDSAARILRALKQASYVNPTFWIRILQMLQMQFEHEGVSQLAHFDGENITMFLDTLVLTYNSEMDLSLYQLFFEYFEGLIRSGDIPHKFTASDLKELYRIYEKAFFYRLKVDTFFKTLQQRIDEKSATEAADLAKK